MANGPAPPLGDATTLAIERTRLAAERTMMAWVRTATSLITFGFSVYKFFDVQRPAASAAPRLIGPREFGLILISTGLVSLILAVFQQRQHLQLLRKRYGTVPIALSLAAVLAAIIAVLGILAFWVVLFRE